MKKLIVFTLLLSSCSTLKSKDYEQGSIPQDQFDKDSASCEMEAAKNQSSDGMSGMAGIASLSETYDKVFDPCMRSKGYKKK